MNKVSLVPSTSNAAFNKAVSYLGIKLVELPLNEKFEADFTQIKKKITKNTVCIVANLPNKSYGVCDNIEAMASIAKELDIPFHVDAGIGGMLYPYLPETLKNYKCDFEVKGITSISIEYHKYGLSPLGMSVLMFSSRNIRKCHYFIYNKWAGGIYPCSGIPGSRTPAVIISSFAILLYLGNN